MLTHVSRALTLIVIPLCAGPVAAQAVDQVALIAAYNQACEVQSAAIDAVVALDGKSTDAQFVQLIGLAKTSIRAAAADLTAARFNVVAAGTTASAYALALREGRLADANTAASLWGKQATLVRSQIGDWGMDLATALQAAERAKQLLKP
jgi:hypothetical protein